MIANKPQSVDEYIASFPIQTQLLLNQLREVIKKTAPKAEEVISYSMPAYKQQGVLVYFAGYKNHIGFYPTALPIKIFKEDLTKYKTSKGAIQFPLNKSLPIGLIKKIIKFKIKQNLEK